VRIATATPANSVKMVVKVRSGAVLSFGAHDNALWVPHVGEIHCQIFEVDSG